MNFLFSTFIKSKTKQTSPPEFPEFKKLELSDRDDIEKIVLKYLPYSDFNFTSLWSWNTKDEVCVSVLNDNLIVKFSDYITGEAFYSFLGTHKKLDTAEKLIDLSIAEGLRPELRLIPEISIEGLEKKYEVLEDVDNFDYILPIEKIATYVGNRLRSKKNLYNRFIKSYVAKTVILNPRLPEDQKQVSDLYNRWIANKGLGEIETQNEMLAFNRIFGVLAKISTHIVIVGVMIDNKLAGFIVNEFFENEYTILHFEKADEAFVGIYAYLMFENARILKGLQKKLLNYEQDLGLPGLRLGKRSFRPVAMLKKYIIKPQQDL